MAVLVDRLRLSLADAKGAIGIAVDDVSQDGLVADLASQAAEQVAAYVNDPYVTATGTELTYPATFDVAVRSYLRWAHADSTKDPNAGYPVRSKSVGGVSKSYDTSRVEDPIGDIFAGLAVYRRRPGL